jgi:hypothetical protein
MRFKLSEAVWNFAYPMVAVVCECFLKSCSSLEETRRYQENAQIPRPMCVEVLLMISMLSWSRLWWMKDSLSDKKDRKKIG